MPKYLIDANYHGEAIKGLLKEGGSARRRVVDELMASVGGKVDSFYLRLRRDRRLRRG